MNRDEPFMREALKEAERAFALGEKAVGAVIVHRQRLVARAHDQTGTLRDPTAHAAMIAVTQAVNTMRVPHLREATLYVTQEPCCMCVGAVLLSGLTRLVFGSSDSRQGACGSLVDLPANERLNRRLTVVKGILASECAALLRKAPASSRA